MSRAAADMAAGGLAQHSAPKLAFATERPSCVVVGVPRADFPRQLTDRLRQIIPTMPVLCVDSIEQFRDKTKDQAPQVIILDDRILGRLPLGESVADLATITPVILVAAYERHAEIARMVAAGRVDFVPRSGDWELLAASLIERRLRSVERARGEVHLPLDSGEDMGEIFRHEINNPLTGILGNAELLLAHSDKFPAAETQRIRTVVELAVRLREAVRRVSDRWAKGRNS
jgi:signal transduction histidine kinase